MGGRFGRRQFLFRAAAAAVGAALAPAALAACEVPVAGSAARASGAPNGGGTSGGGTPGEGGTPSADGTSGGGTPGGGGTVGSGGYGARGVIMFDWATSGALTIDLASGRSGILLPYDTSRYGWDVSRDGKRLLQATQGDDTEAVRFSYTTIADDTVLWSFDYHPANGDLTNGWISPDEKRIAVAPTFDDGIVILDTHGTTLHNLTSVNGQQIGRNAEAVWMPDNSLLLAAGDGAFRTDPAFTKASRIRTMDYGSWGSIAASPDGTKVSYTAGNHIWMMGADGSNPVRVTDSSLRENPSTFSPDGSKLLIGTDFHATGSFGSIWDLAIMPADGTRHRVDKGADDSVVFIKDTERGYTNQACDGLMYWR